MMQSMYYGKLCILHSWAVWLLDPDGSDASPIRDRPVVIMLKDNTDIAVLASQPALNRSEQTDYCV